MSKYTTTIRNLILMNFDFGLQDYPIFDEEYRDVLNQEILDFYYTAEIGFETPALFKHYLNSTMRLVMPKYNAMYVAQSQIALNPLANVILSETSQRTKDDDTITASTNTGNGTNNANGTSNNKNLYQDTPQGELASTDINNQKWATNLNMNSGGTTSASATHTQTEHHGTENRDTTENYSRSLLGNNGRKYNIEVYHKLVSDFKSIDMLVIEELQDLFMGVL